MAHIVLADDGIEFDGESPAQGPLGGVESSIVNLTRALADRGHDVSVHNMCSFQVIKGVSWNPCLTDFLKQLIFSSPIAGTSCCLDACRTPHGILGSQSGSIPAEMALPLQALAFEADNYLHW